MKTYFLPVCFLFLFIYSCNSVEKQEQDNQSLQDSVIAVHDEVMPLMGGLVRSSIKVDSILMNLPEIKSQNPGLDTSNIRKDLLELKEKLDQTTESMNDWMFEFEVDHEGKSNEEIQDYLKSELSKIHRVKENFEEAAKERDEKLRDF